MITQVLEIINLSHYLFQVIPCTVVLFFSAVLSDGDFFIVFTTVLVVVVVKLCLLEGLDLPENINLNKLVKL